MTSRYGGHHLSLSLHVAAKWNFAPLFGQPPKILLPYKSQIGRGRALIYAENADKKINISASICVYPCFPRPFLEMYGREIRVIRSRFLNFGVNHV
jgi:hypothetical protein